MLFHSQEVISSADPSTAFIALRWTELFDHSSPDTFQPRLLNIPGLVEELHRVAQLALVSSVWDKHLLEIGQELKWSIEENSFLLKNQPKYSWHISIFLN